MRQPDKSMGEFINSGASLLALFLFLLLGDCSHLDQVLDLVCVRTVQVSGALHKLHCLGVDLAFDVVLVALDGDLGSLVSISLHDESETGHVVLDFRDGHIDVFDVVFFTEGFEVVAFLVETALHFEDVEQRSSAQFFSVRLEQNVRLGFLLKSISQLTCFLEVKLLKKCLSELSEAV